MFKPIRSLKKKYYRLLKFPLVKSYQDLTLILDPRDWIDNRLAANIPYESAQIAFLKKAISDIEAHYFFDIGANIGLYSLKIASLASIQKIYAYEPLPQKFIQLAANAAMNGYYNKIEAFNYALSDTEGTAEIHFTPKSSGVSRLTLVGLKEKHKIYTQKITIPLFPLDVKINLKGETIAFKIDVEGHSLAVLTGMKNILKQNKCLLQIEMGTNEAELRSYLSHLNYEEFNRIGEDSYFRQA